MKQQCFEDICGCTVDSCPITYSMKMIGGKWRPIIIMRIAQNINRFGVLHRGIDGISKNMLTRELRELEKNDIISRKIYEDKYQAVGSKILALGKAYNSSVSSYNARLKPSVRNLQKLQGQPKDLIDMESVPVDVIPVIESLEAENEEE